MTGNGERGGLLGGFLSKKESGILDVFIVNRMGDSPFPGSRGGLFEGVLVNIVGLF